MKSFVRCDCLSQDGRILFMDPMEYGHRYCELQASKDAVSICSEDKQCVSNLLPVGVGPYRRGSHLVYHPKNVTKSRQEGKISLIPFITV